MADVLAGDVPAAVPGAVVGVPDRVDAVVRRVCDRVVPGGVVTDMARVPVRAAPGAEPAARARGRFIGDPAVVGAPRGHRRDRPSTVGAEVRDRSGLGDGRYRPLVTASISSVTIATRARIPAVHSGPAFFVVSGGDVVPAPRRRPPAPHAGVVSNRGRPLWTVAWAARSWPDRFP